MNPVTLTRRAWRYWQRNGRYWTFAKAANAALARLACRLRLRYVPSGPVVAKIEATNICNGTCVLCPVAARTPGHRPYGRMDMATFRELVDRLKGTLVVLDLSNWGESLLHPDILAMIRYAHHSRIYTYLSTNLHTVRPEHVEGLMTSGLDELALSLHGLSEQTYAAYQPGYSFAQAAEVIERLTDARRRLGRGGKPKLWINFVVTAINEHEAPALPAFAARHGVECCLSEPSLNLRFAVSPDLARRRPEQARQVIDQAIERWLPRQGHYDRPAYRELSRRPTLLYQTRKVYPCDWPWTKLVVNWDGGLSPCCGSYRHGDDLGRYAGGPLTPLWNSPAYRRCRAAFAPGARPAPNGQAVLCDHCPGMLL